jgi:hypothetical protein
VRERARERIEVIVFVPTRPINTGTSARIGDPMDLVTGDAPQPGETPREESNPWTFSDPDTAFWQGEAHRDPAAAARSATLAPPATEDKKRTDEAVTAHAAGGKDTTDELAERDTTEEPPERDTTEQREERDSTEQREERDSTEQREERGSTIQSAERDHDQLDDQRFNTTGPISEYATTTPESKPTEPPVHSAEPHSPDGDAAGVPDVMVLPEPGRTRPTVALDRGPVPGQPPSGLSRLSRAPQRPPSPLLENSPFWLTEAERAERAAARAAETRDRPGTLGVAPRRPPASPRRPATGLFGLVALALVAAFFAWVSAEPFWLAVGHGDRGTATVVRCTGDGVTQRCAGQFRAAGNEYAVTRVTLLGVQPGRHSPGAISPARMVNSASRQAYVGEAGLLVQLRWVLGFVLVLLCGIGIAGLTGARRLETARARRGALLASLTGPLLLLAGFLWVAY